MNDADDIVKRLRDYSLPSPEDYPDWQPPICAEAAAEIERLRADNERLRDLIRESPILTDATIQASHRWCAKAMLALREIPDEQ